MRSAHLSDKPAAGERSHHHHTARWPALLALLAIGGIYALVAEPMTPGPPWLLLALVVALIVPLYTLHHYSRPGLMRALAFLILGIVTLTIVASALFLLTHFSGDRAGAPTLLRDAALIWAANVLTFALWYWEIDGGGPAARQRAGYDSTDLLFPQPATAPGASDWRPGFVDYLFLAFNTSTAFSPTDTLALSPRAKLLMMTQSLLSLIVLAGLAARAINTL